MKFLLSVAIILAAAFAVSGRQIPAAADSRVAGGSTAAIEAYPYQVSLRVYFVHFCGGSIVNNRWVLTSANCIVSKRADEISVIAGTNLLSEAGQMYQAVYKTVHPSFNAQTKTNDIGLIYVSREIVLADKIQAIPLPTADFTKVNYPAKLTGWGAQEAGGDNVIRLQEVQVTVISQETCIEKQPQLQDSNLCTLDEIGLGACAGDAGGPLVADGVQIGIVSYTGVPCASGKPDVYTRVFSFTEWIATTIKNFKGKAHLLL